MNPRRSPEEIRARWDKRRKLIARAVALHQQGKSFDEIAADLGVSHSTAWYWVNLHAVREQRKAAS